MPDTVHLSDRALAVFAFALYHQLASGSRVTQVIREDGAGHHADSEAIEELSRLGLVQGAGNRVSFTERGESILSRLAEALRQATAAS